MSKHTVDKLCSMYSDSSLRKAMLQYVTGENYWNYGEPGLAVQGPARPDCDKEMRKENSFPICDTKTCADHSIL